MTDYKIMMRTIRNNV